MGEGSTFLDNAIAVCYLKIPAKCEEFWPVLRTREQFILSGAIRQFGEIIPDVEYVLRPGGYALIFDSAGRVATVRTPMGYYLPGGGQHQGETLAETVIREVAEECGIQISIVSCLGTADELTAAPSESMHYRKRCTFFLASSIGMIGESENDHILVWLSLNLAQKSLSHASHRWILTEVSGMAVDKGSLGN